jgi:hypothetical protein
MEVTIMAINKRTAVHIANEISMTREQLKNAEEQIEEMQAQREAILLKLRALEGIVTSGTTQHLPPISSTGEAGPMHDGSSMAPVHVSPVTGLRDGIRSVLREANGHGMRGKDIRAALTRKGVVIGGKSNPATRIAGELYRLRSMGQLRKRGNKYFALDVISDAGG